MRTTQNINFTPLYLVPCQRKVWSEFPLVGKVTSAWGCTELATSKAFIIWELYTEAKGQKWKKIVRMFGFFSLCLISSPLYGVYCWWFPVSSESLVSVDEAANNNERKQPYTPTNYSGPTMVSNQVNRFLVLKLSWLYTTNDSCSVC